VHGWVAYVEDRALQGAEAPPDPTDDAGDADWDDLVDQCVAALHALTRP